MLNNREEIKNNRLKHGKELLKVKLIIETLKELIILTKLMLKDKK